MGTASQETLSGHSVGNSLSGHPWQETTVRKPRRETPFEKHESRNTVRETQLKTPLETPPKTPSKLPGRKPKSRILVKMLHARPIRHPTLPAALVRLSTRGRLALAVLGLALTGCGLMLPAGGGAGNDRDGPGNMRMAAWTLNEPVRDLPKSRRGNMKEYTVRGRTYRTMESAAGYQASGTASWYGAKFHGRETSSGEIFDMHAMTAAHKSLPLPTFVRVRHRQSGESIIVKVNDRGPFIDDRLIDLSYAAALNLGIIGSGTAEVELEALSTHVEEAAPELPSGAISADLQGAHQADPQADPQADQQTSSTAMSVHDRARMTTHGSASISRPSASGSLASLSAASAPIESGLQASVPLASRSDDWSPAAFDPVGYAPTVADRQVLAGADERRLPAVEESAMAGVIQIGAFREQDRAAALVERTAPHLSKRPFIVHEPDLAVYRVRLGPLTSAAELDEIMADLASLGVDGQWLASAAK